MSTITQLIQIETERARAVTIYEMIGRFGDRLPQDVQQEMSTLAEQELLQIERRLKKIRL